MESLLGTRRVSTRNHTYSDTSTSTNVSREKVPVLTVDEIRRMPHTVGLLAYRNRRGVLLDLQGWTQRSDAGTVTAGKAATEQDQQQVFAQQYETARVRRAVAGERR